MASIVAPPTSSDPVYTGKGFRGANGVERIIFGYYLPNNLSEEANVGLTAPYQIVDGTTLFDVSSLTPNHEVVAFIYVSPNTIRSETNYTVTWHRDRDSSVVYSLSFTRPHPGDGLVYLPGASMSAWIGWLADDFKWPSYPLYKEIQENGLYHVTVEGVGGENISFRADFAVVGIPPSIALNRSSSGGFNWTVRLSNYFDTSNYIRAGICTEPFTDGQNYEPVGIVADQYATSSTLACVAEGTVTDPITSASLLYGFAQAANGHYYQAGSFNLIANFEWTFPKVSGGEFNLTAEEWNDFTERINAFRSYKGLAAYPLTKVSAGQNVSASVCNDARYAIRGLSTLVPIPGVVSNKDIITAAYFNSLVQSLNSTI